jgi:hypothetical protein
MDEDSELALSCLSFGRLLKEKVIDENVYFHVSRFVDWNRKSCNEMVGGSFAQ